MSVNRILSGNSLSSSLLFGFQEAPGNRKGSGHSSSPRDSRSVCLLGTAGLFRRLLSGFSGRRSTGPRAWSPGCGAQQAFLPPWPATSPPVPTSPEPGPPATFPPGLPRALHCANTSKGSRRTWRSGVAFSPALIPPSQSLPSWGK